MTARVTAAGGAVSSISLGRGLVTSTSAVVISSAPRGLSGFSLGKGESRSLVFAVKGAKAGATVLSAVASGRTSSGTVTGSGALSVRVGGQALAITLATSPKVLKLNLGKSGSITPGEVTVTATLANKTKATIDGVQMLSLNPVPQDPTEQLDQLAFPRSTFPVGVGSIAPGASVTKQFVLKVTGDGQYEFRALALYRDPAVAGGNGRAVATGGGFEAVAPVLFFTAELQRNGVTERNGSSWVKGGEPWYVGGKIKNLSASKTICLAPLIAQSVGNATATGMQDVSTFSAGSAGPPVAGLLKPGQSLPLGLLVTTSSVGGTRGTVELPVRGFVAKRAATCQLQPNGSMAGAGAALRKDEVGIAEGSSGPYVMHVDVSATPSTALTAGSLEFFGRFGEASFRVYSRIALGLAAMAKSARSDPQFYVDYQTAAFDPIAASRLAVRANSNIMAITQIMVNYLARATPAEAADFWDYVAKTLAKVKNDAYDVVAKQTEVLGRKWYARLLAAEESGDANQIWTAWAGLAGEGVGELNAIWLQLFVERAGVLMTAKAPQLEAAAKAATAEPKVLTTSKGGVIPAGRVLNPADAEGAWAIPARQDKALQAISDSEKVRVGARSRQAVSARLEAEGAVWKNSNFHQKTVGPIDRAYLGMASVEQGLVATRTFTPAGEAAARQAIEAAGLSAERKAEALAALELRINEGGADLAHLRQLATMERQGKKGWVDAGFNARESGPAASPTSVKRWRRFQLVETPIRAKDGTLLGTLFEPLEENIAFASAPKFGKKIPKWCRSALNTVLCSITGDIDLVYVVDQFGGSLSPSKMLRVFRKLEAAGFAHTDLVTWVEQQTGSFFFPGKEKQLAGLALGKEACIEYGTDGTRRATYLNVRQSILTGKLGQTQVGPNAYQLAIIGGENAPLR